MMTTRFIHTLFRRRTRLVGAVLLALTGCESLPVDIAQRAPLCVEPDNADGLAQDLLVRVNEVRAKHGSFPLTLNAELSDMAGQWACTMIEDDFFGHLHPSGDTFAERWERSAFGPCYFGGENLALNYHVPAEVFQAWMESQEGHREEILRDQYAETGIAIRSDGQNVYWVQHFLGGTCQGPPVPFEDPAIDPLNIVPTLPTGALPLMLRWDDLSADAQE
jgi:uncharacterized protein YkwD